MRTGALLLVILLASVAGGIVWLLPDRSESPSGSAVASATVEVRDRSPALPLASEAARRRLALDEPEITTAATETLHPGEAREVVKGSGRVVDALSGAPIQGALLRWPDTGSGWVEVKSDASGRFELESMVRGRWELLVAADGYVTRRVFVVSHRQAEIALTPGRRCQGRIVDRATGAVLRGTALLAISSTGGFFIPVDETGEFTAYLAAKERRTFIFSAPSYCSLLVEVDAEEWTEPVATFPLQREAVLKGIVTDGEGKPLEARLTLQAESSPEIPQSERSFLGLPGLARDVTSHAARASRIHVTVESSSDGYFSIGGLPPLELPYSLRAVASGYLQQGPDEVVLRNPGVTEARVILMTAVSVTVTAEENGKRWLAGSFSWSGPTKSGRLTRDSKALAHTGTVEAGLVRLQAEDSHGTVKHIVELELEAGEQREIDLSWEESGVDFRGIVLQANGVPAASAVVRAYAQVGTSDEPVSLGGGKTDASGRFELSVPAADTYELRALLGTASASEKGVLPGSEVVLRLPAMGSFRARFVDALTGEPRDPGNGFYWRPPGQERFQKVPHWSVTGRRSPPGGDLEFRLPQGTIDFRLVPRDQRFSLITVEGVEVTASASAPILIRIGPGCDLFLSLRGSRDVEDLRTRALVLLRDDQVERIHEVGDGDDAAFEVDDDDTVQKEIVRQMLDVNGSGEALVRGLRPGRYTIRAFPADVAFTPQWFEVPNVPEYRQAVEWQ